MTRRWFKVMMVFMLVGMAAGIRAQEVDPLLQLLIDNKVITKDQAAAVQAEYDKKKAGAKEEIKQVATEVVAQAKPNLGDLKGLKVGGTLFISHQNGETFSSSSQSEDMTDAYNRFVLKRAYLDVQKEITPWMKARITPDILQDSAGNYVYRMKYAYALFHWKGNEFFSNPELEVGVVHTPWEDFSQGYYAYRMQDTTFLERVGLISSADVGSLFQGNLGQPLPKTFQDEVSKKAPGRWGSYAIGVFNGGGYATSEKNMNKTVQARLTFRPLPDYAPGLQLHLFGITGKGNVAPTKSTKAPFLGKEIYPEYSLLHGAITYQHPYFTLAGEYVKANGNTGGTRYYKESDYVAGKVNAGDILKAYEQEGFSFFAEAKFPGSRKWSVFGRMDYFDPDTKGILILHNNRDVTRRYITGVGYRLYKDNMLVLDYDVLQHSRNYKPGIKIPDEGRVQLTLQVKF
jgi:hypothetical protein